MVAVPLQWFYRGYQLAIIFALVWHWTEVILVRHCLFNDMRDRLEMAPALAKSVSLRRKNRAECTWELLLGQLPKDWRSPFCGQERRRKICLCEFWWGCQEVPRTNGMAGGGNTAGSHTTICVISIIWRVSKIPSPRHVQAKTWRSSMGSTCGQYLCACVVCKLMCDPHVSEFVSESLISGCCICFFLLSHAGAYTVPFLRCNVFDGISLAQSVYLFWSCKFEA